MLFSLSWTSKSFGYDDNHQEVEQGHISGHHEVKKGFRRCRADHVHRQRRSEGRTDQALSQVHRHDKLCD